MRQCYVPFFAVVVVLQHRQAELPGMNETVPLVIFGVMGIIAGVMALWLPETLYSPMPQTVEQAEAWEEDYRIYCCKRHRTSNEVVTVGLLRNEKADGNPDADDPHSEKKTDTEV